MCHKCQNHVGNILIRGGESQSQRHLEGWQIMAENNICKLIFCLSEVSYKWVNSNIVRNPAQRRKTNALIIFFLRAIHHRSHSQLVTRRPMSHCSPWPASQSRRGCSPRGTQHMDMVTLMPRFPLSAKSWKDNISTEAEGSYNITWAMLVSKTRQSEFMIAELTPSWIDLRGHTLGTRSS